MSDFMWHQKESRKAAQVRKKHEREEKAQDAKLFLSSVTSGVEAPPFEIIIPESERRLEIPKGCIGLLIGKKGEHLKAVEEKFQVKVKIDKDSSGHQSALISGKSPNDVAAAVKELDFDMRTREVPSAMAGWLCGKAGRHLKMMRDMTGVAVLSLRSEGGKTGEQGDDEEGLPEPRPKESPSDPEKDVPKRCWIEIKGLRPKVEDAEMCLDAHMSYYSVFLEMDEVEQQLDRQIAAARGRISRRAVSSRSNDGHNAQGSRARSSSPSRLKARHSGPVGADSAPSGVKQGGRGTGRGGQARYTNAVGAPQNSGMQDMDGRRGTGRGRSGGKGRGALRQAVGAAKGQG
eukprot:TRINITY_DN105430_c0_g1_i1.p1 TRINITY_DN105430_c0_g1~~TRINITY_DN105430_c0_g1_i1.p1  ORF type:complete len:346 (-),score=64.30 TRINITY_DN105430_c0_g1_i1:24-1061(-)